jgi:uncharacterized delta-60 repeat protein
MTNLAPARSRLTCPWCLATVLALAGCQGGPGQDGGRRPCLPVAGLHSLPVTVAVLRSGAVVVPGRSYDPSTPTAGIPALVRLTPSGALDPTFGRGGLAVAPLADGRRGVLTGVVELPDGRLLGVGYAFDDAVPPTDDPLVARFSAAGEPDVTFGLGGIRVHDRAMLSYYLYAPRLASPTRVLVLSWGHKVAALGLDGELDAAFGDQGVVALGGRAEDMVLDDSGRPVIVATSTSAGDGLYRLGADGVPDAGFDGDGFVPIADFEPTAVAVAPDGRIVAVGGPSAVGSCAAARLEADGARDATFGIAGAADCDGGGRTMLPRSVVHLPDDRILLGGNALRGLAADGAQDQTLSGQLAADALDLLPDGRVVATNAFSNDICVSFLDF